MKGKNLFKVGPDKGLKVVKSNGGSMLGLVFYRKSLSLIAALWVIHLAFIAQYSHKHGLISLY